MKRSLGFALVVLLSACTPAPSQSFNSLQDYYDQQLSWESCEDTFQCASLVVPVDYKDPGGDHVDLALIRHRASDESTGVIVTNPGGPGGSGIDYLLGVETQFTEQIIENFDLVSFDPRGVGKSAPIDCIDDSALDDFLSLDSTPDTPSELAEVQSANRAFFEDCKQQNGDWLFHISTTETVQDLDILRAALDQEKLNYLGKSYGTTIGSVYAHLFPERVGHFVLDGAVAAELSSTELALGQAQGFEVALHRFAKYCLTLGKDCGIGTSETKILNRIRNLVTSLDSETLPGLDGRQLTESLAWTGIVGPLYLPEGGWDWLIEALRYAYDGDGSMLIDISDWFNNRDLDGEYLDNANESFIAVSCVDNGPSDQQPAEIEAEFVQAAPILGRMFAWGELMCANWPKPEAPLTQDVSAPTAPPILVIGTTYDPATPDIWARQLADELEVGVYINYQGDGHTAYLSGSEALDIAVDDFFVRGKLPADGTSYERGSAA